MSGDNSNGVFEVFLDRLKHPVLSSFITAWLFWNWQFIYTLLGGWHDTAKTINYATSTYLQTSRPEFITFPLITGFIFLVVGQFIRNIYILWLDVMDKLLAWAKAKLDGLSPVPKWELNNVKGSLGQSQKELNDLRRAFGYIEMPGVKTIKVKAQSNPPAWRDVQLPELISGYDALIDSNTTQRNQLNDLDLKLKTAQQKAFRLEDENYKLMEMNRDLQRQLNFRT